jgi:hypothetical protein
MAGAFTVASLRPGRRLSAGAAVVLGAFILAVAAAPTFEIALGALAAAGAAAVVFSVGSSVTLQLAADPAMRGRVMALYATVFLGSTPIGGPLTGWIASAEGPRVALLVAGVATLAAGLAARD